MKRITFAGDSPERCVNVYAHPDDGVEVASAACCVANEQNIQANVFLSEFMERNIPCIINWGYYYNTLLDWRPQP